MVLSSLKIESMIEGKVSFELPPERQKEPVSSVGATRRGVPFRGEFFRSDQKSQDPYPLFKGNKMANKSGKGCIFKKKKLYLLAPGKA